MPFLNIAKAFIEAWDLRRTKVLRPSRLVFLCGGIIGDANHPPASARDAFLRNCAQGKLDGAEIILAERANTMLATSSFTNLLDLEEYIGSIVDSVILFVESPGSICELGAFCKIPQIAERLTTFVMNDHVLRASFIRNGPLQYMKAADGTEAFSTYDWKIDAGQVEMADFILQDILVEAKQSAKLRGIKESFDIGSLGHTIYAVLGVAFILRGGLIGEIKECIRLMAPGMPESKIRRSLDIPKSLA